VASAAGFRAPDAAASCAGWLVDRLVAAAAAGRAGWGVVWCVLEQVSGCLPDRSGVRVAASVEVGCDVGGRTREVPLPDVVGVALAEHLRLLPAREVVLPWREPDGELRPVNLLFTTRHGTAINRNHYNPYVWKPALREAGVDPSRANGYHALRHHFASVLLDGGVSIRALAEYLGHADPGFTLRVYTHLMPRSEDRTRAVVDAAFGPRVGQVLAGGGQDGR
jgi:integrase